MSSEEKTKDYENFEKGMIYMKILKKGGGGNKIHVPCACGAKYHFAHHKGNNSHKKCQKMYNFIIKSAMFKRSIITTYDAVPVLDEK